MKTENTAFPEFSRNVTPTTPLVPAKPYIFSEVLSKLTSSDLPSAASSDKPITSDSLALMILGL